MARAPRKKRKRRGGRPLSQSVRSAIEDYKDAYIRGEVSFPGIVMALNKTGIAASLGSVHRVLSQFPGVRKAARLKLQKRKKSADKTKGLILSYRDRYVQDPKVTFDTIAADLRKEHGVRIDRETVRKVLADFPDVRLVIDRKHRRVYLSEAELELVRVFDAMSEAERLQHWLELDSQIKGVRAELSSLPHARKGGKPGLLSQMGDLLRQQEMLFYFMPKVFGKLHARSVTDVFDAAALADRIEAAKPKRKK